MSQYEELMQQSYTSYRICGACHHAYVSSDTIEVKGIQRVHPFAICKECAKKISDALKASEGKNE